MKILSKYKDYYDFCSGVYGIDPLAIYDRRNSELICNRKNPIYDIDKNTYVNLLCGDYVYGFIRNASLQRRIQFKANVINNTSIPLLLITYPATYYDCTKQEYFFTYDEKEYDELLTEQTQISIANRVLKDLLKGNLRERFKNPILADSFVPSLLPAKEIWQNIQDYLLRIRELPIVDNSSDIQKLERKGFDKKISFRHPIK